MVKDIVLVAGNNTGHSVSASCWLVPVDVVLLVFFHSVVLIVSSAAELLLHSAFACECETSKVSLHRWRERRRGWVDT